MSTIAERGAAGAAFLDEHDPDWWRTDVERAIDLDRLNLAHGDVCILGQRCPLETLTAYLGHDPDFEDDEEDDCEFSYHAFAGQLTGFVRSEREQMEEWAVSHGFNRPFLAEDGRQQYVDLTAEWKRVITGRRAAS